MNKIKIVADSGSDVLSLPDVEFASAPLKIITEEGQYVDNASLDVEKMASEMQGYKGKSSTSCPSPDDWIEAFGDAEEIICVTITALLSGSYNTACIAKQIYEEKHPQRRVFVINSRSTGPEMGLIIERMREMIISGCSFDEIISRISDYNAELLFVLSSMKNLVNNGRVSPIAAKLAGMLGIRAIGRASDEGILEMLCKAKGDAKAVEAMVRIMAERGYCGGKVKLSHCLNEPLAAMMKRAIIERYPEAEVEIGRLRGLCSFYAEKSGMIVGYEI